MNVQNLFEEGWGNLFFDFCIEFIHLILIQIKHTFAELIPMIWGAFQTFKSSMFSVVNTAVK